MWPFKKKKPKELTEQDVIINKIFNIKGWLRETQSVFVNKINESRIKVILDFVPCFSPSYFEIFINEKLAYRIDYDKKLHNIIFENSVNPGFADAQKLFEPQKDNGDPDV
jgi:hypothetical protein